MDCESLQHKQQKLKVRMRRTGQQCGFTCWTVSCLFQLTRKHDVTRLNIRETNKHSDQQIQSVLSGFVFPLCRLFIHLRIKSIYNSVQDLILILTCLQITRMWMYVWRLEMNFIGSPASFMLDWKSCCCSTADWMSAASQF